MSRLSYIVHSRAWYADLAPLPSSVQDEVHVIHDALPPHRWEFAITLQRLGPTRSAFRIEVFGDAWQAFKDVPELFVLLAGMRSKAGMSDIEGALVRCGFTDGTPNEDPDSGRSRTKTQTQMHHCSGCGKTEPVRG